MTLESLKTKIKTLPFEESIAIISDYIDAHPASDEALTIRGMKYWGAAKYSLAINDYLAAIKINPDSRARFALSSAREILDYRNKDLYNP